jgi:3-isopropylmalate/(R)-2-methylmalate dehydratase small subunit
VRNVTTGATAQGAPVPPALQDIVLAGGVEAVLRSEGYLAPVSPAPASTTR